METITIDRPITEQLAELPNPAALLLQIEQAGTSVAKVRAVLTAVVKRMQLLERHQGLEG